jgi:hypothetical protein
MRSKTTMLIASLTLAIAAIGASSASAATLYTNAAHTTPVAVGTQFNVLSTNYANYASPYGLVGVCGSAQLFFTVTQNSGGVFKASVGNITGVGGQLAGCTNGWTRVPAGGTLQISGSAITVGTRKAWLATTLTHTQIYTSMGTPYTYAANFTGATGNPPVNGIWAEQPTAGAAPVALMLNNAPSLTSPGQLTMNVGASYYAQVSYSLG